MNKLFVIATLLLCGCSENSNAKDFNSIKYTTMTYECLLELNDELLILKANRLEFGKIPEKKRREVVELLIDSEVLNCLKKRIRQE